MYFIHSPGDYWFELSIDWFDLFCVHDFFSFLEEARKLRQLPRHRFFLFSFGPSRLAELIKFPKFRQTSSIFAHVSLGEAAPKPSDSVLNRLRNVSKGGITDGCFWPFTCSKLDTDLSFLKNKVKKILSSRFLSSSGRIYSESRPKLVVAEKHKIRLDWIRPFLWSVSLRCGSRRLFRNRTLKKFYF